ncbi:SHOCT domain-containing protein [Janthinobacterium sp.]|uniref:SHOCT domain-containing protein n=1 Tax=Janthinobacterium sp. TaxID=1871054 RepID=UPI00293D6C97|nr:SHOCT domain-containing protein [Janthinobacterium sp.]
MQQLSPNGQQAIDEIARRHGFGVDAVLSMLESVINGNGSMAQFNHPEFSGSGQWMRGGMTMVSDMFNNNLKGRVDGLCSELARLLANQPDLIRSGSFQSQSQGGQHQNSQVGQQSHNGGGAQMAAASLFVPPAAGAAHDWWGPDLRWPNSTGAQNGMRYAYFAQARRLAIDLHGRVTIYDTLQHQIGGFSQQQSAGATLNFTSQCGLVDVSRLPIISIDGVAPTAGNTSGFGDAQGATASNMATGYAPVSGAATPPLAAQQRFAGPGAGAEEVFAMIEKLADLRNRELLSAEEFVTKKTELLARL